MLVAAISRPLALFITFFSNGKAEESLFTMRQMQPGAVEAQHRRSTDRRLLEQHSSGHGFNLGDGTNFGTDLDQRCGKYMDTMGVGP